MKQLLNDPRTRNRLKKAGLVIVMLIGLAMVFNKPIRNYLIAHNSNKYQIENVKASEIKKNAKADASFDFSKVETINTETILAAQMQAQQLPVIGGIAIPDVGINLPIFKGLDNVALSYGAGTMKENQVMGGKNNYALASHHVYGFAGSADTLFSPLERTKKGMNIYLTDKTNVYTYKITEVTEVMPEQSEVINDHQGKSELTLVTCTDAAATARTIVKAELTNTIKYSQSNAKIQKAFTTEYNQVIW